MRPALSPRLTLQVAAILPGFLVVGLMLVWAEHDGGYDADTWYWGALAVLAALAAYLIATAGRRPPLRREVRLALVAFALYVAWSYLSIAWASSPGDALDGSNRALLYLLVFALMATLPWSDRAALAALLAFVLGVGVIGLVMLWRLGAHDNIGGLITEGRLLSPTGYYNSTVALFTMAALPSIYLATRRDLPGVLRGALIALACADLQLALIGQSRGWLFTLPFVVLAAFLIVADRLRVAAAALLPALAVLLPRHRLLAVYQAGSGQALTHAAQRAGHAALLFCAAAFVVGTLVAWADGLLGPRPLSPRMRRLVGTAVVAVVLAGGAGGAAAATHGDPVGFVRRQWQGFLHRTATSDASSSHFASVGTSRYDFWRVSVDAFLAHPLGGLGQDNFADYYVPRRRTPEEPRWTHSLELRLLVHTGVVGFILFATFLGLALGGAIMARRHAPAGPLVGAALLPLMVWLIHGSLDWFWEIPALAGPALGFLGMALALDRRPAGIALGEPALAGAPASGRAEEPLRGEESGTRAVDAILLDPQTGARPGGGPSDGRHRARRLLTAAGATAALLALVAVLGFPYLSVREQSRASDIRQRNPQAALSDLADAARLDPLTATPGRVAGTIALESGLYPEAERRFRQSIDRQPGGWFAWFGDGLAASALGDAARARSDFARAVAINSRQPALTLALARVDTLHPLSPAAGLSMLVTPP